MSVLTGIGEDIEEMLNSIAKKELPYKCILYNDDTHDMLEVINQIAIAVPCEWEKATALMFQAHKTGRACVKTGTKEACEKTKRILEDIKLKATIEEG
jgi:ATP-dependent Clp protease adaptor protein ClpS